MVGSDMKEDTTASVLDDGQALRAPPTAQRVPSDMEEVCAPSALEDGSALRAPPKALSVPQSWRRAVHPQRWRMAQR